MEFLIKYKYYEYEKNKFENISNHKKNRYFYFEEFSSLEDENFKYGSIVFDETIDNIKLIFFSKFEVAELTEDEKNLLIEKYNNFKVYDNGIYRDKTESEKIASLTEVRKGNFTLTQNEIDELYKEKSKLTENTILSNAEIIRPTTSTKYNSAEMIEKEYLASQVLDDDNILKQSYIDNYTNYTNFNNSKLLELYEFKDLLETYKQN